MSCLKYALDGKCCICYDEVDGDWIGKPTDNLTKVETRSGIHYMCDDCFQENKQKYENNKIDIFEVKE